MNAKITKDAKRDRLSIARACPPFALFAPFACKI
jgi:hypothetical protein